MADHSFSFHLQTNATQDTVPIKVQREQVDSGINPIFLLIERKSQEVEVEKQTVSKQRVKAAPKAQTDTTCHICPKGYPTPLYLSLENVAQTASYTPENLLDQEYYKTIKRLEVPVYFELQPSKLIKGEYPIVKQMRDEGPVSDWILFPILGLLLMMAIIRITFSRYLVSLLQGVVHLFHSEKVYEEKSVLGQSANFFLDCLFFLASPILAVYTITHLNPSLTTEIGSYWLALYIFLGLLGLRLFRFISIKTLAFISDKRESLNLLYFNLLLYPRILGLVIVPLVFLLAFTENNSHSIVLFFTLSLVAIALAMRSFRSLQVFVKKGFSIFYFLLYLCALEIVPLLILFKEILKG
jgi:hypothetical protein